jgi:glycosyltransferase involved in cell wall biosynthesis
VQKSGDPEFRKRLAIIADVEIVLWSGPLQGTGGREIEYAVQVAHLVTRQTKKFHFVFAFKPDQLKENYFETLNGNRYVTVMETDQAEFQELQNIAALFISPICDKNRTVAPPITWIEMMQRGVPVVTTPIDGVDEIVENNENGIIAESEEDAAQAIMGITDVQLKIMKNNAIKTVNEKYNIKSIAKSYTKLWKEELNKRKT